MFRFYWLFPMGSEEGFGFVDGFGWMGRGISDDIAISFEGLEVMLKTFVGH